MTDRERLELLLEAYDHLYDCWECYNVAPCGAGEKYYPLVGDIFGSTFVLLKRGQ